MRGKLLIYFLGLFAVTTFAVSPFVTAWSIREAIRTGNGAYLEATVDWPRVKETLKVSMSTYALGEQAVAGEATTTAAAAPRPGLWQRIKNAYGRRVVSSMVDNMVSPAGLSRLFSYRQSFNENVRGLPDEREVYSLTERIQRSWRRVIRAEFLSPTRFAMEMRDKVVPHRSYAGVLQLQGLQWRLVHLEVKRIDGEGGTPVDAKANVAGSVWSRLRQAALPR